MLYDLFVLKNIQPNYIHYPFGVQESLALDVPVRIQSDDPVYSFLEAIERINLAKYFAPVRSNNSSSHDRVMLLRVILFSYMTSRKNISLRELESLCRTDCRFLYLSNYEMPSHQAFKRVLDILQEGAIDDIFFELSHHIAVDLMCIDPHVQFVDGTKIEANAHKNSFVYKKRIVNSRKKLYLSASALLSEINSFFGYDYPLRDEYQSWDLFYVCQYLMEVMVQTDTQICYGIGHRKSSIQRYYDSLLKMALKLMEYEEWLYTLGNRNSCSKTDLDATFMATKWDYYNQSGVTRPCYNCQIAVSDGLIVNADIFQNPGDTLTWQAFMDRYHDHTGKYPCRPVADAGYGSLDNYLYNLKNGIELVQKYGNFGKKKDRRFQKRIYNVLNWKQTEEGFLICPEGRVLDQYEGDNISRTRGGNLHISQMYAEKGHCEGCPRRSQCFRFGKYRRVGKNVVMEELQGKVDENLGCEEGKGLCRQRSIQVEGAFGILKQDRGMTRFRRRGLKGVKMEFLLNCLGLNLYKYHLFWLKQRANNLIGKLN